MRINTWRLFGVVGLIFMFVTIVSFAAGAARGLEPEPATPPVAEEPCTWNGRTVEENRPGWWEQEQANYQAILEGLISAREENMTLEEAAQQEWAPRVGVGPDVTALDLPAWMRNMVVPIACASTVEPEPAPSEEPAVEGMTPEEIAAQVQLYIEQESSALQEWIAQNDLSISVEEAAQRWVDASASGWETEQPSPWGICAPDFLTPASLELAGTSIPEWVSSRIVGYGSGPDCE